MLGVVGDYVVETAVRVGFYGEGSEEGVRSTST